MAVSNTDDEIVAAPETVVIEMAVCALPKTAKDDDPFLVAFDQPIDAENPLDWPVSRKWTVTDVLSATGFNRILVSTVMAPALSTIASEFDMNSAEAAMSLSIYVLATAVGPLIIGPLSEIYGRRIILHGSSLWFLVFNLVCGFANNKGTLIAARFLAGFGASAIYSLAGGVLGDIWRPEQRGKSLGIYLLIPLLGAAVGPIIGGFIVARTTWRWMFWSTSIFQVAMMSVSVFSFDESYGPLILRRRAQRLREQTGDQRYRTEGERRDGKRSPTTVLARALTRPLRLLFFHPIIQVSSILDGFNYGILYIVLSTFSTLWVTQYHQSVQISGLHYIACSLGEIAGSQIGGPLMDYMYRKRRETHPTPEARLPFTIPTVIISWIGILAYGWVADYRVCWLAVDICIFVALFGMQLSSMGVAIVTAYVIDVYGEHTSSAMAAGRFVESSTAFLFPLFAPSMYQALGYGWANTILALAGAVLGIPLSLYLWKSGDRLRAKATSTY